MDCLKKAAGFILGPIATRKGAALLPNGLFWPLLRSYLTEYFRVWSLRGFVAIGVGYCASRGLDNPYFIKAAQEQLSALSWNLMAVFGFICALLAILAHSAGLDRYATTLRKTASSTLCFTSQVGALGMGVLCGLFAIIWWEGTFEGAQDYIAVSFGLLMLATVFILNLVVWWVAYCLRDDVSTPAYFCYLNENKRLSVVLSVLMIVLLLFLTAHTKPHDDNTNCTQPQPERLHKAS